MNNFFTVRRLANGIQQGGRGLREVPEVLVRLIESDAWRHYVTDSGREYTHDSFERFATAQPFEGLGCEDIGQLERLCVDHPKAREALQKVGKSKPGPKSNNNIMRTKQGTSQGYTLERLHRESPELYEQVCDGVLSANAAAIQAGFRTRAITVPIDVDKAAAAIKRHFTASQIARIIERLSDD